MMLRIIMTALEDTSMLISGMEDQQSSNREIDRVSPESAYGPKRRRRIGGDDEMGKYGRRAGGFRQCRFPRPCMSQVQ